MQFAPSNGRLSAYGATIAVVLLASSAPAISRVSLARDLGALDLVFLRCVVGGLVFLPLLLVQWSRLTRQLLVIGMVLAFLHGWGMHLAAIAGLQFSPSSHASALGPGFLPIWVMLWRWIGLGSRPPSRQLAGFSLIAMGALLLVGFASRSFFDDRVLLGDLLFLLSSGLAAAYLVYVQQHALDPLQAAALVAVYSGGIALLLPWVWPAPLPLWTAAPSEILIQAAFQGFGMGAGTVLFATYATRQLGSQRFSVFLSAIPVLSLLLGRSIAGDRVHAVEAIAVLLVGSGIFVVNALAPPDLSKPTPILNQ